MKFWRLLAHRTQELMICSWGAVAELSRQKASSACAAPAPSPLKRWCHASSAQTAPPEVPLRPTTSCPLSSCARRSLLSTPAVNAVWLPPPWHAIATRLPSARASKAHLRLRRLRPARRKLLPHHPLNHLSHQGDGVASPSMNTIVPTAPCRRR